MQFITEEERQILHDQMLLIAEKSKNCSVSELVDLTGRLMDICAFLHEEHREPGIAGFRQQEGRS